MNEKDKEIKAIAKVLDECCNKVDENGNLKGNKCAYCEYLCDTNNICCSYNKKEAETLYNAGYRKIPEGSVVLTREEHMQMLRDCNESNKVVEERTRKGTAKEILALAIKHNNGYETDMERFIAEFKEQYGVVEE